MKGQEFLSAKSPCREYSNLKLFMQFLETVAVIIVFILIYILISLINFTSSKRKILKNIDLKVALKYIYSFKNIFFCK